MHAAQAIRLSAPVVGVDVAGLGDGVWRPALPGAGVLDLEPGREDGTELAPASLDTPHSAHLPPDALFIPHTRQTQFRSPKSSTAPLDPSPAPFALAAGAPVCRRRSVILALDLRKPAQYSVWRTWDSGREMDERWGRRASM